MPVITFVNKRKYYAIFFNGILHLLIKKTGFIGIQAWKQPTTPEDRAKGFTDSKYVIEYHYENNTSIISEYDKREKWEAILTLINQYIK